MGWFLVIVGLVIVGVAFYYSFASRAEETALAPHEGDNRIDRYQNMVHPDLGMIESRLLRMKINSHVKTQEVVNQVTRAILDGMDVADYARRKQSFRDEQYIIDMMEMQSKKLELRIRDRFMKMAAEMDMDIVTFLKVRESQELKNIDLQFMAAEYNIKQENMSRIQQEVLELVDRSTHRLFGMYDLRKELEKSNDPAKDDKLRQLNYNIQVAEDLIRGEQARYREAALGQDGGRTFSDSDSGGRYRDSEAEDQKPNRGRGRPRGSRNRATNQ